MKIRVTVTETVYKTLEVDTNDFGISEETNKQIFELAETINDIKADPNSLLKEWENQVVTQRDVNSVEIISVD